MRGGGVGGGGGGAAADGSAGTAADPVSAGDGETPAAHDAPPPSLAMDDDAIVACSQHWSLFDSVSEVLLDARPTVGGTTGSVGGTASGGLGPREPNDDFTDGTLRSNVVCCGARPILCGEHDISCARERTDRV